MDSYAERYIDVREVSSFLSCSPQTIYNWVNLGRVPYYKIGNRLRFKRSEIESIFMHR